MAKIESSVSGFGRAVQQHRVVVDARGHWSRQHPLMHRLSKFFGLEGKKIASVAKAYISYLDSLEAKSCRTEEAGGTASFGGQDAKAILKTADIISQILSKSSVPAAKKELARLHLRVVSLKYRLGYAAPVQENVALFEKVQNLAENWKSSLHIFDYASLTARENDMLRAMTKYPSFMKLVLEDRRLREEFFEWAIRDKVAPEPFILFPATARKITECGLASRIGYFDGKQLKVELHKDRPILTLPFEGKPLNILNPAQEVVFKGGYVLTVREIFKVFADRKWGIGNLEYANEGIINWNPKRFGWFNAHTKDYERIDFDMENWWEQLPVYKEVTPEEAGEIYGKVCDGEQWVVAIKASREHPNMHPVGTHCYLEIAVPTKGKYRIFDFGKFSDEYPRKWYHYFKTIAQTIPAVISCPDENIFYSNRQQAAHPVLASSYKGRAVMNSIKKDILYSFKGNLFFQFLTHNCCHWATKKARKHFGHVNVPDYFGIRFEETRGTGILGKFLSFLRCLPYTVRWVFLTSIFAAMGGLKGRVVHKKSGKKQYISLINDPPWTRGNSFLHPGRLFEAKSKTF